MGVRKSQAMLELLHPAYYSAALALCPQASLRLAILTTPVICGPVILPFCLAFFPLLTGTVNWACLSWCLGLLRLGWGQIAAGVNSKRGAGGGGSDF